MTPPADARPVRGRVKWFDPARGFGFVVPDNGGPDILLAGEVLRAFGLRTAEDRSSVVLVVADSRRGPRAETLLALDPPDDAGRDGLPPDLAALDPARVALLPLEPARVRWFDAGKGFGFVTVWGRPGDVLVHLGILRRSGLAELVAGDAVAVRVIDGPRGLLAAELRGWAGPAG